MERFACAIYRLRHLIRLGYAAAAFGALALLFNFAPRLGLMTGHVVLSMVLDICGSCRWEARADKHVYPLFGVLGFDGWAHQLFMRGGGRFPRLGGWRYWAVTAAFVAAFFVTRWIFLRSRGWTAERWCRSWAAAIAWPLGLLTIAAFAAAAEAAGLWAPAIWKAGPTVLHLGNELPPPRAWVAPFVLVACWAGWYAALARVRRAEWGRWERMFIASLSLTAAAAALLLIVGIACHLHPPPRQSGAYTALVFAWTATLWGWGCLASLAADTPLYRPTGDPGRCGACGYDLRGSPGPACPECGAERVRRSAG